MDARFRKIGLAWQMATKRAGDDQAGVAYAVYSIVMGKAPSYDLRDIESPLELCNYISIEETGASPSKEEMIEMALHFNRGGSENLASAPQLLGCLMAIPTAIAILAVVAVVVRDFSWIVLTLGLFARVWHGFARWLVGGGHPGAKTQVMVAVTALFASLVASLLHLLDFVRIP